MTMLHAIQVVVQDAGEKNKFFSIELNECLSPEELLRDVYAYLDKNTLRCSWRGPIQGGCQEWHCIPRRTPRRMPRTLPVVSNAPFDPPSHLRRIRNGSDDDIHSRYDAAFAKCGLKIDSIANDAVVVSRLA